MNKRFLRLSAHGLPGPLQRLLGNERIRDDINTLRRLVQHYPSSGALEGRLMNAYASAGRWREALALRRRGLIGKRSAALHFHRANWSMTRSDFRVAERHLRLCLRIDRGYFRDTAHFWRAEALFRLGLHGAANRALQFVPDDYSEHYFLGRKTWSKADLANSIDRAAR